MVFTALMIEYPFDFATKIKIHKFGRLNYTVAYLPKQLIAELPLKKYPRLRVEGEVNGDRFGGALHPAKGKWYVLLPRRRLKKLGLKVGDEVYIGFEIADQDAVDVPAELRHALTVNQKADAIWKTLTAGKRRSFAFRVSSAKQIETRERRVEEVVSNILALEPS